MVISKENVVFDRLKQQNLGAIVQVFLNILQNSNKNSFEGVSFSIKKFFFYCNQELLRENIFHNIDQAESDLVVAK